MNVRAAIIHMIGDIIQSVGVMAAAIIIYIKPTWTIADPICTFLFSVLVLMTTVPIFIDVMAILMETCPEDIDIVELFNEMAEVSVSSKLFGPCKSQIIILFCSCLSLMKFTIFMYTLSEKASQS